MRGSWGGNRGSGPLPPGKSQKYMFFIAILVQITKPPSQHSICRSIIGPLAKRLVGRWWPAFCVIWILGSPLKHVVAIGPPLTKLSGSAHDQYTLTISRIVDTLAKQRLIFSRTFHAIFTLKPNARHTCACLQRSQNNTLNWYRECIFFCKSHTNPLTHWHSMSL